MGAVEGEGGGGGPDGSRAASGSQGARRDARSRRVALRGAPPDLLRDLLPPGHPGPSALLRLDSGPAGLEAAETGPAAAGAGTRGQTHRVQ